MRLIKNGEEGKNATFLQHFFKEFNSVLIELFSSHNNSLKSQKKFHEINVAKSGQ